jgi:hypothetical protein
VTDNTLGAVVAVVQWPKFTHLGEASLLYEASNGSTRVKTSEETLRKTASKIPSGFRGVVGLRQNAQLTYVFL